MDVTIKEEQAPFPSKSLIPGTSLPKNFYVVANNLFQVFWNLEIDDPAAAKAFFAKIDLSNCRSYGLMSFAARSSCLSVIRDRLEATVAYINNPYSFTPESFMIVDRESCPPYRTIDEYYNSYRKLFGNVLAFYPKTSAAYAKAVELSDMFKPKWAEAMEKWAKA